MELEIRNSCTDYDSYRANRCKSLFNVESGANFSRDVTLPLEEVEGGWNIGVVVGPSGSGKSSIGRELEKEGYKLWNARWPKDTPIVDAILPKGDFDAVTGALATVGLGDVPAWLRPYDVLSMGERFRADLARVIAVAPDRVVLDEFTSVVDRQIACIGAMAFAKSWRRSGGQAVLLTCHYDVLPWVDPDWIYDTATGEFALTKGCLQRPSIVVDIQETGWSYWPLFEPHHYLKAGPMPFGTAFVGFVDGDPVVHLGMSGKVSGKNRREARACRMVVMPEWQGAGIGMRFLNALCERELTGEGFIGRPVNTQFHTNHPALCMALRRDRKWRQISYALHGGNARTSVISHKESNRRRGIDIGTRVAWGGHFRGVQGFRYFGQAGVDAWTG